MRFALLAVLCLAPVDSRTQTPPLSADEAVAQALKNSPTVTAAARRVAAAEEGVRAARAPANPQLALTPAVTRSGSDEELLIQQPLEVNGGRAARAAIAQARLRLAEAEAITTRRDVALAVKTGYYRLVRARARRALASELLQDAEEFHRAAVRQVELGARPGIEQTQAAMELSIARQQLMRAEAEEAAVRAALNAAMGRDPADSVGELVPFEPPSTQVDREPAIRSALETRSELAEEAARIAEARAEQNLVRSEGRLDLAPQLRAERFTRGVEGVGVGLAITLPVLDYGSRRHRIRQAEQTERALQERAASVRLQIRREVEQALAQVQASDAVVRTFRDGLLDQARRLLDASRVGFQVGATNIIAVLEARRSYRAVNLEYIDALAALAEAHAGLERATASAPVQGPGNRR